MTFDYKPGDALLIVDAQNDFFPEGALGVPNGDQIIPILNEMIALAQEKNIPIIASRDWHPENHHSFREFGGPWPRHCVQETAGAAFHPAVNIPKNAIIVNKAFDVNKESYSAFEGHTVEDIFLLDLLSEIGITRFWIGGLALDYCVKATVLDGIKFGFDIEVVLAATKAIDTEKAHQVLDEIKRAGAQVL